MNIVEIIEKKKNRLALSREEIAFFVDGAADGGIPDYQLSALLMANPNLTPTDFVTGRIICLPQGATTT